MSTFLNNPGTEWLFLVSPIAVSVIGGLVIMWRRTRQLRRWNLRISPAAPSTAWHRWVPTVVAILAIVSLVWFVLVIEIAPDQQNRDIGFGVTGIVIGLAFCLWTISWANHSYAGGGGQ